MKSTAAATASGGEAARSCRRPDRQRTVAGTAPIAALVMLLYPQDIWMVGEVRMLLLLQLLFATSRSHMLLRQLQLTG